MRGPSGVIAIVCSKCAASVAGEAVVGDHLRPRRRVADHQVREMSAQ